MSESKNEAFHRLAVKRVDVVVDAIRIFSNLAGPSYEWGRAEAEAYLQQITDGVSTARSRFAEAKGWGEDPASEPAPALEEPAEPDEPVEAPVYAPTSIVGTMQQAEAETVSSAVEMVGMQKLVIDGLQRRVAVLEAAAKKE